MYKMIDFLTENNLETISIHIGNRLRQERKKRNISQEDLANEIHVDRQTLMKWETKDETAPKSLPTIDQLISICEYYKVSPSYLLCEYDYESPQLETCMKYLGLYGQGTEYLHLMNESEDFMYSLTINFINHFLESIDQLPFLLYELYRINILSKELENDTDKENIKKTYMKLTTSSIIKNLYRNSINEIRGFIRHEVQSLPEPKCHMADKIIHYWDVLNPTRKSQIEANLSIMYMDSINSSISEYKYDPDEIFNPIVRA